MSNTIINIYEYFKNKGVSVKSLENFTVDRLKEFDDLCKARKFEVEIELLEIRAIKKREEELKKELEHIDKEKSFAYQVYRDFKNIKSNTAIKLYKKYDISFNDFSDYELTKIYNNIKSIEKYEKMKSVGKHGIIFGNIDLKRLVKNINNKSIEK